MARDNNMKAYPVEIVYQRQSNGMVKKWDVNEGMSLLNYFAGQALIGLLSNQKK